MLKKLSFIILLSFFILSGFIFSSCDKPLHSSANTTQSVFTPTAKFKVHRMIVDDNKKEIYFEGNTELSDATLQTQLYQDDKPLEWWPTNQDIKASGYIWEITVHLEYKLPTESNYILKIWYKDNPSAYGIYPFDLEGPPSLW